MIKSLTAIPLPDFNLCISLLGERPPSTTLDEPDPFPSLLPILTELHNLLLQCRFPAFWALYRSDELESLRDNYTVECSRFEDSIRDVIIRAVKATFKRISIERLGTYLDLTGKSFNSIQNDHSHLLVLGGELNSYLSNLGWKIETGVVIIPPNPDNQVEATVVRENIHIQRQFYHFTPSTLLTPFQSLQKLSPILRKHDLVTYFVYNFRVTSSKVTTHVILLGSLHAYLYCCL